MNRYEISNDFRKKFIEENENVWGKSLKALYISINGEEARTSTLQYSMEKAEHGLVIFTYDYTIITQNDKSLVSLFFNANGEIDNFIVLDGWKFHFSAPVTAMYRCDNIYVYMTKGALQISIKIFPWTIAEVFPRIWKLFCIVKTCSSQIEIDFAKKIFEQGMDIDNLKTKNLIAEAKIDSLNTLIASYKQLLDKVSSLACLAQKE